MPEAKTIEDNKNANEICKDIKNILNKVTYFKLFLFCEVLTIIVEKHFI